MKKFTFKISDIFNILGIVVILLFCGVLIFITATYGGKGQSQELDEKLIELTNWDYEKIDKAVEKITLPRIYNPQKGERMTLKTTLPAGDITLKYSKSFYLLINHLDVKIYLDNELIYDYNEKNDVFSTSGTYAILVDVPFSNKPREIKLEITPLLEDKVEYALNSALYGSRDRILDHETAPEVPRFIFIYITLAIGLIALIFMAILYKNIKRPFLFHLGIFAILASLYSASDTTSILLFFNNQIVHFTIYASLSLMPIPIISMVGLIIKEKKSIYFLKSLLYLNFFTQTILSLFKVTNFRIVLPITHTLIILSILFIGYYLIKERKNKEVRHFAVSVNAIIIGTIIDVILFYTFYLETQNGTFFQLGVYIFSIYQFIIILKDYLNTYKASTLQKVYQDLAFKDVMTSLKNRNAIEKDYIGLETLARNSENIWTITVDINNLKRINDSLGHNIGDEAIKYTAMVLKKYFGYNHSYRMGGDEFLSICVDISEDELLKVIRDFKEEIKLYKFEKVDWIFSVSVGYDLFSQDDICFQETLKRSDEFMYIDKASKKEDNR